MKKSFVFILSIVFFSCFSKSKNRVERSYYPDIPFSPQSHSPFDYDNYLFGKIKTISIKSYSNIRAAIDSTVEMHLSDHYIYNYDENKRLYRTDIMLESGQIRNSEYNFVNGHNFYDFKDGKIIIDSSNLKITKKVNKNQELIYSLDSLYRVINVKNKISDKKMFHPSIVYENNLLAKEVNAHNSYYYRYDPQKRLTEIKKFRNNRIYVESVDSIPEFVIDYEYNNDTLIKRENWTNERNKTTKMLLLKDNVTVLLKSIYPDYYHSYEYNDDLSLVESTYVSYNDLKKQDSTIIVYGYNLDSYGNWVERYDNEKLTYKRVIEYDNNGNWVKMVRYEGNLKTREIYREYKYLE